MGIPAVYFPRCLSWPRSNGEGRKEGTKDGSIRDEISNFY